MRISVAISKDEPGIHWHSGLWPWTLCSLKILISFKTFFSFCFYLSVAKKLTLCAIYLFFLVQNGFSELGMKNGGSNFDIPYNMKVWPLWSSCQLGGPLTLNGRFLQFSLVLEGPHASLVPIRIICGKWVCEPPASPLRWGALELRQRSP